jgi:DNA-binding NarL/FixJ family response regulator
MTFGIIDDHLIFRDVIRGICGEFPDAQLIGEFGTGSEAVAGIVRLRPDFVILDIGLPDFDGCEVLHRIHRHGIRPCVLVVSGYCSPYLVFRLARLGISGFLDKAANTMDALRTAISKLRMRQNYFSNSFVELQNQTKRDGSSFDKLLTNQQILVLALVAHNFNDEKIASYLNICSRTVENHRTQIMSKLAVHSRVDLIKFAVDQGFGMGSPPSRDELNLRGNR